MFVYADLLCSSKEEIFDIWKSGDIYDSKVLICYYFQFSSNILFCYDNIYTIINTNEY